MDLLLDKASQLVKEAEMEEQREILKQQVVDLVKNFIETKGGITPFDLQVLFASSPDSYDCNEVYSVLRLKVVDQMGSDPLRI